MNAPFCTYSSPHIPAPSSEHPDIFVSTEGLVLGHGRSFSGCKCDGMSACRALVGDPTPRGGGEWVRPDDPGLGYPGLFPGWKFLKNAVIVLFLPLFLGFTDTHP